MGAWMPAEAGGRSGKGQQAPNPADHASSAAQKTAGIPIAPPGRCGGERGEELPASPHLTEPLGSVAGS